MHDYKQHSHEASLILVSGILEEDADSIFLAAESEQFHIIKSYTLNRWVVMMFERK